MRRLARTYAWRPRHTHPSGRSRALIRLSAYSTTTMAPSTSMPTARIRPNITMFEIVTAHHAQRNTKHNKERGRDRKANEQGRACAQRGQYNDHNQCDRGQDGTLKLANHRGDGARLIVRCAHFDRGLQSARPFSALSSTSFLTSSAVSIRLKPLRFTTCSATDVSPLKRAVPVRSSKVKGFPPDHPVSPRGRRWF